jgi:hypothetical protein
MRSSVKVSISRFTARPFSNCLGTTVGAETRHRPFRREASAHAGASHVLGDPGCSVPRWRERAGTLNRAQVTAVHVGRAGHRAVGREQCFITRQQPEKFAWGTAGVPSVSGQSGRVFRRNYRSGLDLPSIWNRSPVPAVAMAKTSQGGMSIATAQSEFMQADQGGSRPSLVSILGSKRPTRRPSELFSRSPTPMGGQR